MAFQLQVQFTGLCLHVHDTARDEVAVVLPDARLRSPISKKLGMVHRDFTDAAPHVGYVRVDLASCVLDARAPSVPRAKLRTEVGIDDPLEDDCPVFEIIYRFKQQTLNFGLTPIATPIVVDPHLPRFNDFAEQVELNGNVFKSPTTNPSPVLMRTLLSGGTLDNKVPPDGSLPLTQERWSIDRRLSASGIPPLEDTFASDVYWKRDVTDKNELLITLTDLDGTNEVPILLRPVTTPTGDVIRLKIANLCSLNVLEWPQLEDREAGMEDSDFKWLFRLFEPASGLPWKEFLNGILLPAPRIVTQHPRAAGRPPLDCFAATMRAPFPAFDRWVEPAT